MCKVSRVEIQQGLAHVAVVLQDVCPAVFSFCFLLAESQVKQFHKNEV